MNLLRKVLFNILSSVLSAIAPLYVWLIHSVFELVQFSPATSVPPATNEILLHPAKELAKNIRNKKLSAVAVMTAFIDRVKLVNPIVNAVINERFEAALDEAANVDNILAADTIPEKYSEVNMPFLGVPFTVKECFYYTGYACTTGLPARKNHMSTEDADVIKNIKGAGFIPFIFTNISELCMWYESHNHLFGISRNAYNTNCIVGGSSGGEACILSAAGAVVGVGSDIGGSIRMPCFFNGIFGHKPSPGIVSNKGQHPPIEAEDDSILGTGPMCRYASDLIPLLRVMSGPNISKLKLHQEVDFHQVTFFTIDDIDNHLFVSRVTKELKDVQKKVATYFSEKFGSRVHKIHLENMKSILNIWTAEVQNTDKQTFCYWMNDGQGEANPFWEFFKWCFRLSDHTLAAIGLGVVEKFYFDDDQLAKYLAISRSLRQELTQLLLDDSVLLFPSHPRTAPYHHLPLFFPYDFTYTATYNALKLPVTQCPLGLDTRGLPMGVQVVTSPYNDHLTLAVAKELEIGFGGWTNPIASKFDD